MWQAAGHLSNDLDSTCPPVEKGAGCGHPDDCQQAAGDFRSKKFAAHHDDNDTQSDEQGRQMRFPEVLEGKEQLAQEPVSVLFNAKYLVQFAARDLHAYSGEKTDKHASREEISEKAEAQDSRGEEDCRSDQCDKAGKFDVARSVGYE